MSYTEEDMVYYDDYAWTAPEVGDNPFIKGGIDRKELNRSEGFEMYYFITEFVKNRVSGGKARDETYKKIERAIHTLVPRKIQDRKLIANWLVTNWKDVEAIK